MPSIRSDVKITVLKKLQVDDVRRTYAAEDVHAVCTRFNEGQVFVSNSVTIPKGFCSWAWPVIQSRVLFLALGHDYPWIRQPGAEIVCCPDGLHPVLYKLERIDSPTEA